VAEPSADSPQHIKERGNTLERFESPITTSPISVPSNPLPQSDWLKNPVVPAKEGYEYSITSAHPSIGGMPSLLGSRVG
jgi:hypothetical protein